jgi:diamine N-acetyltransferase
MDKLSLKVPNFDELAYRKQILADPKTMAYNRGYDQEINGYDYENGIIEFNEEKWNNWYKSWVNNEPEKYYAYIMLDNTPIGEVALHYNSNFDCHIVHILIEFNYRGKGYSEEALRLLMNVAFDKLNLTKVGDKIATDREAAIRIFEKVGFKEENLHIGDMRFGKREKCKYFELTKIRYQTFKK